MSGGSYDYKYSVLGDYYVGYMYDEELNEMMKDLENLLHDLEWWQSCDISEDDYRRTADKFKRKWFKRDNIQVKAFIEKEFEKTKQKLLKQLNYLEDK